jgi:hypothetical protein
VQALERGRVGKIWMELQDTDIESDSASDIDDSVGMITNRWKGQLKKYYTSRLLRKEKIEKKYIKCAKKKLDWTEKKRKY